MPVNTKHRLWQRWIHDWRLCRAVTAGERGVKSARMRERTIPRLSGHIGNEEAYNQYVAGAHFFPASGRYREGLQGLLFQAPPTITAPAAMDVFLSDVTGSDSPCTASEFFRSIVGREITTTGRCGILTDFPVRDAVSGARDLTTGDAERRGDQPTWTNYRAESIINWYQQKVNGKLRTMMVVLEEWKTVADPADKFARNRVKQWRVLEMIQPPDESLLPPEARLERGGDGLAYHVEIYRLADGKKETDGSDAFELASPARFPMSGTPDSRKALMMTDIPFDVINAEHCELGAGDGSGEGGDVVKGITFNVAEDWGAEVDDLSPPLLDICTVNLGHLRNSALFEHALNFTGSPQPYIAGWDDQEELGIIEQERAHVDSDGGIDYASTTQLNPRLPSQQVDHWHLGSSQILLIKNENATPGILSAKGEDLSAILTAMERKSLEMVAIGGRIIAPDKLVAEAAKTEEIRRGGERGVVTTIGTNLGSGGTRALTRARDWMQVTGDVEVKVNTDFMSMMDADSALAWSDLVIRGHMPRSDMNDLFKRGRLIKASKTDEEIEREIAENPPNTLPGQDPLPVVGDG
jgi:hypothetical protein